MKLFCREYVLNLDERTQIMGVINVTPDSFYDGGKYYQRDRAIDLAKKMEDEGADIIDVGGLSTRPGSEPVSVDEERKRIIPVLEGILKEIKLPVSIDTYRAVIAREVLQMGVHMVNDISGMRFDSDMAQTVAEYNAPVILMHMKGSPKDMQVNPYYENLLEDLKLFFKDAISRAVKAGISRSNIIIDPGIGFGKTAEHNLIILKNLQLFILINPIVMLGMSRKYFIGKILDLPLEERLEGSLAACAIGIWNGASIIRVHDVKESVRVAKIIDAIRKAE